MGLDRRIGPDHLTVTPERGFGGACLPKDLDALIAAAEAVGTSPTVMRAMADYNRRIRTEPREVVAGHNGHAASNGHVTSNGNGHAVSLAGAEFVPNGPVASNGNGHRSDDPNHTVS